MKTFVALSLLLLFVLLMVFGAQMPPAFSMEPAITVTSQNFLPLALREPTATPTSTPTPLPTPIPQSILRNGGFEQGPAIWMQFSSNGWQLILPVEDLPVDPHNGSWAAWLGGDYDEASILSQDIFVAAGDSTLHFWYWIASQEPFCDPDYDIAGVLINDTAVDAFLLCGPNNTNGWVLRTVDLSAYGGQNVTLYLAAFTDHILNSNLFLDDVSLTGTVQTGSDISREAATTTSTKDLFVASDSGARQTGLFEAYRLALRNHIVTGE